MPRAVRLGLYGCGNRTRQLLDSLYKEGEYEIASAYDLRQDVAELVCGRYGGRVAADVEGLLSSGAEAFIISLEPFSHPDAFFRTLETGKPIFLEKPIAPTAEMAWKMMRAAEDRGVPVHVGLAHRYTHAVKSLRRFMEENHPGRIFSVDYNWFGAVEPDIINMRRMSPDNFRLKISQIPFHCCHALDTMRLLGGEVKSIYAQSIKRMDWEYVTPDELIALFEFENGALGRFHYSGIAYGSSGLPGTLHAENYSVAFSPWGEYDVWYRPRHKVERGEEVPEDRSLPPYRALPDKGQAERGEVQILNSQPVWASNVGPDRFTFGRGNGNICMFDAEILQDFLSSVRENLPMKVTMEDGYRAAEIAGAIEESCKTGRKVMLPLTFKE